MATWRDDTRVCALDTCARTFAPTRKAQRYCCPQHRWLARYRRLEAARRGDRLTIRQQRQARLKHTRRLLTIKHGISTRELAAKLGVSKVTAWRLRTSFAAISLGAGRYRLKAAKTVHHAPSGVAQHRF